MREPKRTVTIISAAPGHHAISFDVVDGVVHIDTAPVIAWQVAVTERQGAEDFIWVTPVPADNCDFDAIMRPDGQVERNGFSLRADSWSGGDVFDSLDAFKAAVLKQAEARPENPPAI